MKLLLNKTCYPTILTEVPVSKRNISKTLQFLNYIHYFLSLQQFNIQKLVKILTYLTVKLE